MTSRIFRGAAVALSGALLAVGVSAAAFAQDARNGGTAKNRLILLGTQGGPVFSTRAQPASVLVVNGTPYLIDAGNGVVRQLALAHIPLRSLNQIFITHNHDDHNADWGTLMGISWSIGVTRPITVYGPSGTKSMLHGFLEYFEPNFESRFFSAEEGRDAEPDRFVAPAKIFLAQDIVGSGPVYKDDNVTVSAAENCHYHFLAGQPGYGRQRSFSFKFQTADKVIVFGGDTGPCMDKLVPFYKGADILVHEVIDLPAAEKLVSASMPPTSKYYAGVLRHMRTEHSTPEEVGEVAAKSGVGMVVLTHLTPGGDALPDSAYSDGVKKYYSGPVTVGRDLLEIPFDP